MSSIYVTESHYYGVTDNQTIHSVALPTNQGVKFSYEPAAAKGSILVSVIGGIARLSLQTGSAWKGITSEYSVDTLANTTHTNYDPPVSGYFDSVAAAEAATEVGQFGVALDLAAERLWLITKRANGTFDKYPYGKQQIYTSRYNFVGFTQLPAPVGVFAPLADEGGLVGLNGGPVHAAVAAPVEGATGPVAGEAEPEDVPTRVVGPKRAGVAYRGGWYRSRR